ncbi:hypothetical protein D3C85_959190 [compost metagenome]
MAYRREGDSPHSVQHVEATGCTDDQAGQYRITDDHRVAGRYSLYVDTDDRTPWHDPGSKPRWGDNEHAGVAAQPIGLSRDILSGPVAEGCRGFELCSGACRQGVDGIDCHTGDNRVGDGHDQAGALAIQSACDGGSSRLYCCDHTGWADGRNSGVAAAPGHIRCDIHCAAIGIATVGSQLTGQS